MRRFSILALIRLTIAVALACVALRKAGDPGLRGVLTIKTLADVLLMATSFLFALAAIGGLFGKDALRARRLGFVALGGGYFVLAFLVLSEAGLSRLPTSRLLLYVHHQVVPTRAVRSLVTYNVTASPYRANSFLYPEPPGLRRRWITKTVPNPASALWRAVLPGAVDHKSFSVVGHCLFALAAGWLGAIGSRGIRGVPESPSAPPLRIGEPDPAMNGHALPRREP